MHQRLTGLCVCRKQTNCKRTLKRLSSASDVCKRSLLTLIPTAKMPIPITKVHLTAVLFCTRVNVILMLAPAVWTHSSLISLHSQPCVCQQTVLVPAQQANHRNTARTLHSSCRLLRTAWQHKLDVSRAMPCAPPDLTSAKLQLQAVQQLLPGVLNTMSAQQAKAVQGSRHSRRCFCTKAWTPCCPRAMRGLALTECR